MKQEDSKQTCLNARHVLLRRSEQHNPESTVQHNPEQHSTAQSSALLLY